MLLQQKGAISIKNHRFLSNQSKNRTFLNKHKGAISKIAPIRPLKCGRRYLYIFNSAFLLLICLKSFENEIAPLKAHLEKRKFFNFEEKVVFMEKLGNIYFLLHDERRYLLNSANEVFQACKALFRHI